MGRQKNTLIFFVNALCTAVFSMFSGPRVTYRWGLLLCGCGSKIPEGFFVDGGCMYIGVLVSGCWYIGEVGLRNSCGEQCFRNGDYVSRFGVHSRGNMGGHK